MTQVTSLANLPSVGSPSLTLLMFARFILRVALAGLCAGVVLLAPAARADSLDMRLEPLIEDHEGEVAISIEHLVTHEKFQFHSKVTMPTASLIKFPIMIEAYRQLEDGKVDFEKVIELKQDDKVPGAGILTPHFSPGAKFSLRDAVRLMIAFSDNTATNLVIDEIGLPSTTELMKKLGFPETRLNSKVYNRESSIDPERSREFGLGSTTADEMIGLLRLLNDEKLVSTAASKAMREHLAACDDKLKFPRFLPEKTKIAFKTGSVEAARTAAGIIDTPKGPVAVCVLTAENADHRWTDDNEGDLLCARVAREVFSYFSPIPKEEVEADGGCEVRSPTVSTSLDHEPVESASHLTLNTHDTCKPSSEEQLISADNAAESDNPTAIELASAKSKKPLPQREPADSLVGPPFTSSPVWAIADSKSGSILWDNSQSQSVREVASTTKIMTALVALHTIERMPELLDELVTFSELADSTDGSSCDLVAGDRLSFRNLLYGLLLPSGNDAAVSVGSLIGRHLEPAEGKSDSEMARFIAAMNREAKRLGMRETRYRNPHGLPDSKHVSSARDLARVTAEALKHPLFREIVASREHAAEVESADGKVRKVTWRSTNRLLNIEGYQGVKTGYTKAAGSCLVSTGNRANDRLIVVVLGAPTAAAAVSDSRNLYRWAWNERRTK